MTDHPTPLSTAARGDAPTPDVPPVDPDPATGLRSRTLIRYPWVRATGPARRGVVRVAAPGGSADAVDAVESWAA